MTGDREPGAATILVVDDEPRACQILEKVLGEDGYEVITATSGWEALARAASAAPQLVLLNIVMPELDGVATLRELRRRGYHEPVIMLTADATLQTAREAMRFGAYAYITKPFHLDQLKSTLRECLEDHRFMPREDACVR